MAGRRALAATIQPVALLPSPGTTAASSASSASSALSAPHRAGPPPALGARLGRLTPDQRAAATAEPGPVLCVAPAGSGKTTTLVARASWLVGAGLARPHEVTAVTFNRRAAEEL